MKKITDQQIQNNVFEHISGGGGWAIIRAEPQNCSRVIQFGKGMLSNQAFLAWNPRLSLATKFLDASNPNAGTVPWMIPDEIKAELEELRSGLSSGKITLRDSHIVRH